MAKKWNFGNGIPNFHIAQDAQGFQGGIIQILDQHPWMIHELQKNFVETPKQGSPKNCVSLPDYLVV